mgnify:CR=1 FL=1
MTVSSVTMLRHGKIELALHHLRDATAGGGRPLLILHGLGESSPYIVPRWADAWAGPIAALDFTGHGASTIPRGGGYTAELLLGLLPDWQFSRELDPATGYSELRISPRAPS